MSTTPAVTGPVTPFSDFDIDDMAALARDVAGSLHGYKPVIARYKISEQEYARVAAEPFFQEMLRKALVDFHKIQSTQKRSAMKAAIVIEEAIPTLGARINDSREPLEKVAQMTKVLADIAGLNVKDAANAAQERITISIDLGADTRLVFDKARAGSGPASEEPIAIPEDRQRQIDAKAIRTEPEGEGGVAPLSNFLQGPHEEFPLRPLSQGPDKTE